MTFLPQLCLRNWGQLFFSRLARKKSSLTNRSLQCFFFICHVHQTHVFLKFVFNPHRTSCRVNMESVANGGLPLGSFIGAIMLSPGWGYSEKFATFQERACVNGSLLLGLKYRTWLLWLTARPQGSGGRVIICAYACTRLLPDGRVRNLGTYCTVQLRTMQWLYENPSFSLCAQNREWSQIR